MFDNAVIEIGEKKYILSFPVKQMGKAEQLLGKPLPQVFMVKKGEVPIPMISDLLILFKCALTAEYPDMKDDEKEALLNEFLSQGKNSYTQMSIIWVMLGKAMGFFRTEADIQKTMDEQFQKKLKN